MAEKERDEESDASSSQVRNVASIARVAQFHPTMNLRFSRIGELQQLWLCPYTGAVEWRAVPSELEE